MPEQALGFRVQGYGMTHHADLFADRQLVALVNFCELIHEMRARIVDAALLGGASRGEQLVKDGVGAEAYADSLVIYLSMAFSRVCGSLTCLNMWNPAPSKEGVGGLFKLQAIPMSWDFAECNTFFDGPADVATSSTWVSKALSLLPANNIGRVRQYDAKDRTYDGLSVSTDPPYYDNVGYADLSDFFYVWLRRALGDTLGSLFETLLTPKSDELVADPFRHAGPVSAEKYFENGFKKVFAKVRAESNPQIPMTVYYAYKQSENDPGGERSTGWDTLLEGMVSAGWAVTGTWPVRSERSGRVRDVQSNALASSVVLACRPRALDAPMTDRRGFISALQDELPVALRELQQGSIAPVDLAQAAIGPGMAAFSRYGGVSEPDGSPMSVQTAIRLINQMLAGVLSAQEGDFDVDTQWCMKWFETYGFDDGPSGKADDLARAMNTSISGLERAKVAKARAGRTILVAPDDLDYRYDPERDDRPTVWESALHLSKRLEEQGVSAAGTFMAKLDGRVDLDAIKELAYLIYSICNDKKWVQTALRFNSLVTSWSDLLAAKNIAARRGVGPTQATFDFDAAE